jgi:hypothetical protein
MDATLAAPTDPEPPAEPRASRSMLAVLGAMAALHALLPAGVAWILHHGGVPGAELAVVTLHLGVPALYWPVFRRTRLGWLGWALVLAVNHGFVLLGALPYLR